MAEPLKDIIQTMPESEANRRLEEAEKRQQLLNQQNRFKDSAPIKLTVPPAPMKEPQPMKKQKIMADLIRGSEAV